MVALFDASAFMFIHGGRSDWDKSLDQHIYTILANTGARYYIGVIDGSGPTYRHKLAVTKPYKGNRDKSDLLERFPNFYKVKNRMINKYGFYTAVGVEADDIVGILSNRFEESVIELSANRKKIYGTGDVGLYAQVLTGDTVDNILGLMKCGPVGAFNALSGLEPHEQIPKMWSMFKDKYGDEARAKFREMFRLVYILRESDSLETPPYMDYNEIEGVKPLGSSQQMRLI
jgi:5'-3' exonuclease